MGAELLAGESGFLTASLPTAPVLFSFGGADGQNYYLESYDLLFAFILGILGFLLMGGLHGFAISFVVALLVAIFVIHA